jgi:K+-sensing histidine kinase KdpD
VEESGSSAGRPSQRLACLPMNSNTNAGPNHLYAPWLRRAPAGLALIGISAWLCHHVLAVNATTAGLVFLVEILLFATRWGLFEALSSAVAAVLRLNYLFLPPVGRFTIADPQNWVALFAFLITAIVASQLSATIRKQAREAVKRREEMERLHSFSRAILLTEGGLPISTQLAVQAARIFESTGIAIFDAQNDKTHLGGQWDPGAPEELLRAAAAHGTYSRNDTRRIQVAPVSLGGKPIGSLAVSGARIPEPVLDSLSNLVAIGLERERSQEAANRAEAAKQSEQLKSTLLDSIAHEFKTPRTLHQGDHAVEKSLAGIECKARERLRVKAPCHFEPTNPNRGSPDHRANICFAHCAPDGLLRRRRLEAAGQCRRLGYRAL